MTLKKLLQDNRGGYSQLQVYGYVDSLEDKDKVLVGAITPKKSVKNTQDLVDAPRVSGFLDAEVLEYILYGEEAYNTAFLSWDAKTYVQRGPVSFSFLFGSKEAKVLVVLIDIGSEIVN